MPRTGPAPARDGPPERHKKLAEEAGVGDLIEKQGLLYAYPSRADFEADGRAGVCAPRPA